MLTRLTLFRRSIDYADMCWNSQWIRQHYDGVVVDYMDTDKSMQTLSENFEGFSQILKEQPGKKWY